MPTTSVVLATRGWTRGSTTPSRRYSSPTVYEALSIDRVARQAETTRAAMYRRYRNRGSMVGGLLVDRFGVDPAPDTGRLRRDLEELQHLQANSSPPVIRAGIAGT